MFSTFFYMGFPPHKNGVLTFSFIDKYTQLCVALFTKMFIFVCAECELEHKYTTTNSQ